MQVKILLLLGLITFAQAQQVYEGTFHQKLTADSYGSAAYADIKNLDNLSIQYFNNMCKENGRSDGCYKYVDLYGVKDKNFPYRKIDVTDTSQLQYSVIQSVQKPSLVLTQDYCNTLDASGSFTFSKSTSTSSTCSWQVSEGITSQTGISATVGIPTLASTTFSETMTLSFSSQQSQSTTHVDTWQIDTTVPVPPLTYVNATYAIIEQDFDCTWTAQVTIRGCVNVWFNDKIDGHWEWWHYVHQIFANVPGFSCTYVDPAGQDVCLGSFCTYQASGTYYGIGGASAHLSTDHSVCQQKSQFLSY